MKTLPWLLVGMLLVVAFWGWLRPIDTAPGGESGERHCDVCRYDSLLRPGSPG